MRTEIRRVCKEFNLTTVYVTHDQKEALSIADRMAILDGGHILQVGSPRDVYCRPNSRTVAHFIGETDFIEGKIFNSVDGVVIVDTPIGRFNGVMGDPDSRPTTGASVTLSIRPECWRLGGDRADFNCIRGRIGESVYLGEVAQYGFVTAGPILKIFELNPRHVNASAGSGKEHFARVDTQDVVVLER